VSVTFPEGVEGEGNVNVVFSPAVADITSVTLAEITAGLDITCYVVGDGFTPGGEQALRQDRRLCSRQVFGVPGSITYTLEELVYVYDPQAYGSADPENEAYETLAPDTDGFIIIRWGLPFETAFAADQIVDVYPVTMGAQIKNAPATGDSGGGGGGGGGGGASSKLTVRQTPFISGPAQMDASVVAA